MQFHPVRQGNLPRLIWCVYVCRGERGCVSLLIPVCCMRTLQPFISRLLLVRPWDIGEIFPEPMQSDSWENDSIVTGVACPPRVMTKLMAACEQGGRNPIRKKSRVKSGQAFPIADGMVWEMNAVRSVFSPDGPSSHLHLHQQLRGPETSTTHPPNLLTKQVICHRLSERPTSERH